MDISVRSIEGFKTPTIFAIFQVFMPETLPPAVNFYKKQFKMNLCTRLSIYRLDIPEKLTKSRDT